MNKIKILNKLIIQSRNIVALTGAGISTNCGIPDFRGPKGLYSRTDIPTDKLFDINYFRKDPSLFYTHIGKFWRDCMHATPSKGHFFLNDLEKAGKLDAIITQNIDGLHNKAGNKNIIDVHGNFNEFKCINCSYTCPPTEKMLNLVLNKNIPQCEKCGNPLKPTVVFFGEAVPGMDKALEYITSCDLFIALGTSLVVYPVAQLPMYLNPNTKFIIINMGETPYDEKADLIFNDDIDNIIKYLKVE